MTDLKQKILQYALHNAVSYGGKANSGTILGKILGENTDLRKSVSETRKLIEEIVKDVNKMGLEKQKIELDKTGFKEEKRIEEKGLPELPVAVKGMVIMRMAPNPNGPLHIGHSRMAILNDEYVKKYNGSLILRFDDTDPKNPNKQPMLEAYKMIEDDLNWLGVNYRRIERASARLQIYYQYFEKILSEGHAYICTCKQEEWSNLVRKSNGQCPCRDLSVKKNIEMWKNMLLWKYKEGEAVGRMKTHNEDDPAIREWVAFRVIDDPQHPLVDKKFKVWPMLDFASAIDDFEFKITHIIRGKDLMISEKRQRILYDYMGWKYPVTKVYGKFITTEDMVVSKSKIQEGIKNGIYTGYDDPKLALLRAFKRRGILPEAIRNYIVNMGLNESETTVDLEILFSENRKLIDKYSDRYMAVFDPIELDIFEPVKKSGKSETEIKYHPDKKEARKIPIGNKIFIQKDDFDSLKGKGVRLMDLFNVKLEKKAVYSKSQEFGFETKKLQWVSGEDFIKIKLISPEGVKEGLGEKYLLKLKENQIIQLFRIGFVRVDSIGKDNITFYFAHK